MSQKMFVSGDTDATARWVIAVIACLQFVLLGGVLFLAESIFHPHIRDLTGMGESAQASSFLMILVARHFPVFLFSSLVFGFLTAFLILRAKFRAALLLALTATAFGVTASLGLIFSARSVLGYLTTLNRF